MLLDQLLRLFDLFNASVSQLAVFIPQTGPELLEMLKKLLFAVKDTDVWLGNTFGISMQKFAEVILKILLASGEFILNLIKEIAGRV